MYRIPNNRFKVYNEEYHIQVRDITRIIIYPYIDDICVTHYMKYESKLVSDFNLHEILTFLFRNDYNSTNKKIQILFINELFFRIKYNILYPKKKI